MGHLTSAIMPTPAPNHAPVRAHAPKLMNHRHYQLTGVGEDQALTPKVNNAANHSMLPTHHPTASPHNHLNISTRMTRLRATGQTTSSTRTTALLPPI